MGAGSVVIAHRLLTMEQILLSHSIAVGTSSLILCAIHLAVVSTVLIVFNAFWLLMRHGKAPLTVTRELSSRLCRNSIIGGLLG